MRISSIIRIWVALLIVLGWAIHLACKAGAEEEPVLQTEEAPTTWKLVDLNAKLPNETDGGQVHILVWEVIDYGGVLDRTERCLIIKRYIKPANLNEQWVLGYFERYPEWDKPFWKPPAIIIRQADTPARVVEGYEFFKERPTDDEIANFLAERRWARKLMPGEAKRLNQKPGEKGTPYTPRLLKGGLSARAWKDVFDRSPPAKLFPELIVKPEKK